MPSRLETTSGDFHVANRERSALDRQTSLALSRSDGTPMKGSLQIRNQPQRQEARLFELRATTQLASVLARQGRAQAGEARLRAIIDAFDTKHPIVDLVAARKVLPTLHR